MKLHLIDPKQSLSLALRRQRPKRTELDLFKKNFKELLGKINDESEEHQKNNVRDFLNDTWYKDSNYINTKGREDLVIHLGKTHKDNVGVIIEAKTPGNVAEMPTKDKPNCKALHQLLLYFMRERVDENNIDLKYLIITNIKQWYIFDAAWFEKHFNKPKFVKEYTEWDQDKKVSDTTELFYKSIAKPFIDKIDEEVPCTFFDIEKYEDALEKEDDKSLISLFKLLSPSHLLKASFEDSNKLDEKFYKELLHIIGLEEAKEGGKHIIRRKEKERNPGSLLEKIIDKLEAKNSLNKIINPTQFGETKEERLFNVGLELCITWINRILFLKLLEAQLVNYHNGDKEYKFLDTKTIPDYGELFNLFHQVLAVDIPKRTDALKKKYSRVPNDDFGIAKLDNEKELFGELLTNKVELSNRAIIKDGLKNNTKCWYEYQQINKTVDYNEEYIIYPNVSLGNNFTLSRGNVIDMTGFIIKSNSRFLLAILNSRLMEYLLNLWSIRRRGGYLEFKVQYLEKIPIKNISAKEQKPFIEIVDKILAAKKEGKDTMDLENQIDKMVYELYELTPEEIKIVEGEK